MCETSNDSIRAGNLGSSRVSCISSSTRFMSGLSTRKRCSKASFAFFSTRSIISRFSPRCGARICTRLPLRSLFQNVGQLRVASFQQHAHVAHSFLIFFRCAQTLDAWAETAFDVILQTRARRLAVNLDVTGAQLKSAIDEIDCFARHRCRQKWAKVKRAVVLNPARDHTFRKRLVDGEL